MKKFISILILFSFIINNYRTVLAVDNTKVTSIKKFGNNMLEINWKEVSGSDGYRIYRASEYNGKYSLIKDVKNNKYVDNISAGTRYYYKIRAYSKESGKNVYSKFSSIKSGYIKAKGVPASLTAEDIGKLKVDSNQLITVSADNENSTSANISFYVKDITGKWLLDFSTIGYVGKNGLGKKQEGDKKTPAGLYNFTTAFGTASKPDNVRIPYIEVNKTHWLVSDPESKYYNMLVSASKEKDGYFQTKEVNQDWNSSYGEQLYKYTKSYQYSLIINYNPENLPYKGSAIFLHCYSGNKYTAGCIALPESKMKYLIQKMSVKNNKITASILIDTINNMSKY